MGREVNKALGFEEPGYAGDLASALLPTVGAGVGKVAGAVVPYVAKRLPGVGNALQALGVEQAREIPGGWRCRTRPRICIGSSPGES